MTNEILLQLYKKGWKDELDNITAQTDFNSLLEERAYILGRADAYYGDDLTHIDLQTDEQILEHIRQV